MLPTCSSPGDAGGTLHFPSPTHIHHVDPASAFKQLRRSLSRSPSKGPAFRLMTSKSASPSPSSPLSPSRGPPPNRSASANMVSGSTVAQSSPLTRPFPSARANRSSARRLSPLPAASRSRSSQRSPARSTLSDLSDLGNATPRSSSRSSAGVENMLNENSRPAGDADMSGVSKRNASEFHDSMIPQHRALAKLESGSLGASGAKSSPLKRSDGIMNLDQATPGSPSAKRRSIYGPTLSSDFDVFDPESGGVVPFDLRYTRDLSNSALTDCTNAVSPLPRRTSTLRKTTLQQRHDKPTFPFPKSRLHADVALESTPPVPVAHKGRPRMSVDNFLPSRVRDSPFSAQGSLPNASVHPMSQPSSKPPGMANQVQSQRHPLSRTITQSSSNSSLAEDSPTHIPVRQPEHRRAIIDFSKSLPVGAGRPGFRENDSSNVSTQASSTETSFSTPENYKLAKPLPAAFMSTGLISKRHKDVEESQPGFHGGRSLMPDTPCKRHSLMGASPPAVVPGSAIGKSRHMRHSFGTPSTPFTPHLALTSPETFGKGVSIFGSNCDGGNILQGASFCSVDGEDLIQSPPTQLDSQSSNDFELPPTPTKQVLTSKHARTAHDIENFVQANVDLNAPAGTSKELRQIDKSSKSMQLPLQKSSGHADGNSDNTTGEAPSVALRFRSYSLVPSSFTRSRFLRNHKAPSPLWNSSCSAPSFQSVRPITKTSPLSPASPVSQRLEPRSPHTPRDSIAPPDPSGLSISAHAEGRLFRQVNEASHSTAIFPPATPTASSRDHSTSFGNGRSSLAASHIAAAAEADPSLRSKFDKVELVGTGEFSQVFRVTQAQESKAVQSYFSLQSTRGSPRTPMPDRVWAVKRSRHPFIGPKDRQRKLQEVNALRALGQTDHTVQFCDSWEDRNHLYIQTEFCEEGSLDSFLNQVGRKARLDDFRIWKIMLELSLGLKHIHDTGFIHLDLKPANVLITFEGVLKIGDFGMAAQWPAEPGIDGEGDREYIGPEILNGQFDKPSDVFALGLIMLEIAGNVVLPENGASWQRLRSGDMSDVPSLTWSSEASIILRDPSGKPLSQQASVNEFYSSDSGSDEFGSPNVLRRRRDEQKPSVVSRTQLLRCGELAHPPNFMVDATHQEALDNVVRWMISPGSADRPTADQILGATGVRWADVRRRAGATIYEGNWGPADEVLADDLEMIDV